jgi:uncharacterized protein YqhQ
MRENMQKNCGIGGQALIEGIMMRNRDHYSMAVRRPDGKIETEVRPYKSIFGNGSWTKVPIIRGALSFIDSLVVGITTLMWSADIAAEEDEEDPKTEESGTSAGPKDKAKDESKDKKSDATWNAMMTGTLLFSLAFSVVLFVLVPYWIAGLLRHIGAGNVLVNLAEAIIRVVIFLGYLLLISRMKDIQRIFSYHGAEHKCINCIEHDMDLTVENVMKSSRQHRRCGTSFLLITIIISVIAFLILGLFGIQSGIMRVVWRLILIPLIAGVSFEILRYAGSHNGPIIDTLVKPGLALQKLVTNEPDEQMCEVAIAAVEAVFDWKGYLAGTSDGTVDCGK